MHVWIIGSWVGCRKYCAISFKGSCKGCADCDAPDAFDMCGPGVHHSCFSQKLVWREGPLKQLHEVVCGILQVAGGALRLAQTLAGRHRIAANGRDKIGALQMQPSKCRDLVLESSFEQLCLSFMAALAVRQRRLSHCRVAEW